MKEKKKRDREEAAVSNDRGFSVAGLTPHLLHVMMYT